MAEHDKQILYVTTAVQWRNWLKDHFRTETEVWLLYPKQSTGKPRIQYNEAVEQALCFGWIDSTVQSNGPDHTMQRFTPRKAKSKYSQANIERLKWLSEEKLIHASLRDDIEQVINQAFVYPPDILTAIKADKLAWKNYQAFSDGYRRIRIAYIDSARKRPDEFKKRLANFIAKTRENKLIAGYGGIDKYY
ncbi:MAG: YdeI/OmpD-associated family protein [Calditrichaeota bacterium]|nr:YdeI/OmpD-associated family protein [Calditrichota bacterium]